MEQPSNPPLLSTVTATATSLIKEGGDWRKYAALKVSSEYDSEVSMLTNKVSARILNGLAKIKASFQRDQTGEIRSPALALSTKHLSVLYDHEDRNALVTAIAKLGSNVEMKYLREIKVRHPAFFVFFSTHRIYRWKEPYWSCSFKICTIELPSYLP